MKKLIVLLAVCLAGCTGMSGHTDVACYEGGQKTFEAKRVDILVRSNGTTNIYREGDIEDGEPFAIIRGGQCITTRSAS